MFGGIGVFSSGQGGRSLRALYCGLSEFRFESRPWWVDSSSTEQFLAQSRQQLSVSAAAGQKKSKWGVNFLFEYFCFSSLTPLYRQLAGSWSNGWMLRRFECKSLVCNFLLTYVITIWNLQIDRYHIPITLCYVLVGILNPVHCSFLSLLRFWAVYKMILQMTVCWCNWYISYSSRYKRHLGLVLFSPIIMIAGFPNFITNLTFIKNFAI